MQKMTQGWFSGGNEEDGQLKPASSLLADWNSYAASSTSDESATGLGLGFDLESIVRSANNIVSSTVRTGAAQAEGRIHGLVSYEKKAF